MYVPAFVYVGLAVKLYVPEAVPYLIVAPEHVTLIPCAAPSYVPVYPLAVTDNVALFTLTLIVALCDKKFVVSAQFTVIVVLPAAFGVTVTFVPLTLTVAMLVLAELAVIDATSAYSAHAESTVTVFAAPPYVNVNNVTDKSISGSALLIVTVLLPVTVL